MIEAAARVEEPVRSPNALELRQRAHELSEALIAARHLQACLEMLGDRRDDVRELVLLRNDLAFALVELADGLVWHG